MLYYFKKGQNNWNAKKKIIAYGEDAVIESVKSGLWFHAGDLSLNSSRPVGVNNDQIKTLIENSLCYTLLETADILEISVSSVENHLHWLGYVNHFDVWVKLNKQKRKNLLDWISTCESLLKYNENVPFLKQIVMGNEKWILYNNVDWKLTGDKQNEPAPTTSKTGLHPKKVILCIWWDWKGVLYYELLLENQADPTSTAPN